MDDIDPNEFANLSDSSWSEGHSLDLLVVAPSPLDQDLVADLESETCRVRHVRTLEEARTAIDDESVTVAIVDVEALDERTSSLTSLRERGAAATILLVDDYTPATFERTVDLEADTYVRRGAGADSMLRLAEQETRGESDDGADEPLERSGRIVGQSESIRRLCRLVARSAPSTAPTLITGESGVGKELVARGLHRLSPRRRRPFVAVNCGAIPKNLIESELFGHEEGAFTGASSSRQGRFEQADTGTLLLDEIGELPREMQVKLLRVVEEQSFERVGGSERISVDVRILSATNAPLSAEVESGTFRRDLYYRLNVLEIAVPPLRDRRSDVEPLWRYFVRRAAAREARRPPDTTVDVRRQLYRYDWPGNVRELSNVARHAVTMNPERQIRLAHLPKRFRDRFDQQIRESSHPLRIPGMTLAELEQAAILRTSAWTDDVAETAEMLDISERKVYYKLKEYREENNPGADSEPRDAQRHHLLIAEDDPELQSVLRVLLSDEYRVTVVGTGRALVEEMTCQLPDLVLTDLRMPGFDGIQVLREKHRAEWDVPIVLGTAYGSDEIKAQAEVLGASAVVDKPFEPERLRRELRRAAPNKE